MTTIRMIRQKKTEERTTTAGAVVVNKIIIIIIIAVRTLTAIAAVTAAAAAIERKMIDIELKTGIGEKETNMIMTIIVTALRPGGAEDEVVEHLLEGEDYYDDDDRDRDWIDKRVLYIP